MPVGDCPKCERIYDLDGFFEHGQDTLWLCECGAIYEEKGLFNTVEVPSETVDLSGLDGRRGLFINKTRLMSQKEEETK